MTTGHQPRRTRIRADRLLQAADTDEVWTWARARALAAALGAHAGGW